jgi:hypothetical protein
MLGVVAFPLVTSLWSGVSAVSIMAFLFVASGISDLFDYLTLRVMFVTETDYIW